MKKFAVIFGMLAILNGCASRSPELSTLRDQHNECLYETAIDTAFTSDDFAYVQGVVRTRCQKYENMTLDYFSHNRSYDETRLESTFAKMAHDAAAQALDLFKNKQEYYNKFYECFLDRTIKRILEEKPQDIAEIVSISRAETSACYDNIMAPYIGGKSNEYSEQRRNVFIEEATKIQVKTIIDQLTKAQQKKAPSEPQKLPKRKPQYIQPQTQPRELRVWLPPRIIGGGMLS